MKDKDPNYVGLGKLNTGPEDPYWAAAKHHDSSFQSLKDGVKHRSLTMVNKRWARDTTAIALKGAYAVITYPLYLLGGIIGGSLRWWYLKDD